MIHTPAKKMIKKIALTLSAALFIVVFVVMPMVTAAAPTPDPAAGGATQAQYTGTYCSTAVTSFNNLADLFKYMTCFLQRLLLPLLFTGAGLVFVWGTVKFIAAKDSSEKEEGQQFMLWGVIAFTVMLSIWGIIHIFNVTFGLSTSLPTVPTPRQIQ